jgi:hypothetical protein
MPSTLRQRCATAISRPAWSLRRKTGRPDGAAASRRREIERDVTNEEQLEAHIQAYARGQEARDARIDECPITTMATVVMMLARRWLAEHRDAAVGDAGAALRDAIETVGWDTYLIPAKLHRALDGRDAASHGESIGDDHPVQNDWNGSAKVALISIERSHAAWQTIAKAAGDPDASRLVDELARLQQTVDEAFPNARKFVRPGFDDGGRRRRRWF